MVHQHFMLVPSQTVTENILLGLDEPRFRMRLPHYEARVAQLAEISPSRRSSLQDLAAFGGEQQRVKS